MNAQEINSRIAEIMRALSRSEAREPSFANDAAMRTYRAESHAIEDAGKQSLGELIGSTLIAFQSISESLKQIAEAQKPKPLLSNGGPARMPKLDQ